MKRPATSPAILGILVRGMLAAGLAASCSSNQVAIGSQNLDAQVAGSDVAAGGGGAGAGGASATGGTTGGVTGVGGMAPVGGTVGAGGVTSSGGSKSSGGTIGTGGTNPSGGTGGAGGCASGWTLCCGQCLSPTAGVCMTPCSPTGGSGPTGGTPSTGGTTGVGGAKDGGVGTGGTGGSAGKICGGIAGVTCATGELCEMPTGACNASDATGTCVVKKIPGNCPILFVAQPVCGCDGKGYDSDCERQAAGVSKRSDGACPIPDAGIDTAGSTPCPYSWQGSCAAGEFCEIAAGLCHTDLSPESCVVKPQACGDVYHPVCGCDGITYDNDCDRQVAGVSKLRDVACGTPNGGHMIPTLPAACTTDDDCCVAMDYCIATAYLVGRTEYTAMLESIIEVDSTRTSCMPCAHPDVQVQCKGGFCAGEEGPSGGESSPFAASHCGYLSVPDAGAPTVSANAAAIDAGTAPAIWGCTSSY